MLNIGNGWNTVTGWTPFLFPVHQHQSTECTYS